MLMIIIFIIIILIIMMTMVTEGGSMLLYFKPGSHPWDTRIQVKLRMFKKETLSDPRPIVALPCQWLSHSMLLLKFSQDLKLN